MKDQNAKAPKTRSGDTVNPVIGSIVKITAIIVIAALIVLITFVTIELIQRNKKVKVLFEDKIHISLADYEIIVDQNGNYDNISNARVKRIMMDLDEDVDISFFFYYSNYEKQLDKKQVELVEKTSNSEPLFVVDLYEAPLAEGEEQQRTFLDALAENKYLIDLDIENTLTKTVKDKKDKVSPYYKTFIITYNKQSHVLEDEPFVIVLNNEEIVTILESYRKIIENEAK